MERIYLDNAAATPLDKRVLQAMMPFLTTQYGNPSSLHYFGQQARSAVQHARGQLAHCLGVKNEGIVFTSGGTEADNLAILGYLRANYPYGGHIITTAVEHQAVLQTFRWLGTKGYDVTILPVNGEGYVAVDTVRQALRKDTIFISVMQGNNETGVIQPIKEIAALVRNTDIVFHVDAVQSFGYLPLRPDEDGIDMVTLCSHKIYGPKGVGALYVRPGIALAAEAFGGPQEHQLRAGTENVAAIVGFGEAAALLEKERGLRYGHVCGLKQLFVEGLRCHAGLFHVNGAVEPALPHVVNFSVRGVASDMLLIALDMAGIAVSAGSACAAGALEPSHVLMAMGVDSKWLHNSIRVSFGKDTTESEVRQALCAIVKTVETMTGRGGM